MTPELSKSEAVAAVKVLNHLLGDLLAATRAFEVFGTPPFVATMSEENRRSLTRMCLELPPVWWTVNGLGLAAPSDG